ncbi:MAG: metallophosphoesterase [Clostridiaceae bacterium]|nr:metallophosphoesterase [Clostridiaceae bacterium]
MRISFSNYKIKSNKVQRHIRILHISDLHDAALGEKNICQILDQKADICLATGDMIDLYKKLPQEEFLKLCQVLKIPILYSFGNHELYLKKHDPKKFSEYVEKLKENGVIILDNAKYETSDIDFFGLTFKDENYFKWFNSKKENATNEEITNILGKPHFDKLTILLAHNPFFFPEYEKWGADIVFSGHVHGGIVILPHIGGLLSPERKFFPRYYSGKYEINFAQMYVSRGIGQSKLKIRINNKPHIIVADINKY